MMCLGTNTSTSKTDGLIHKPGSPTLAFFQDLVWGSKILGPRNEKWQSVCGSPEARLRTRHIFQVDRRSSHGSQISRQVLLLTGAKRREWMDCWGLLGWFLLVMKWIIPENSLRLAPVSLAKHLLQGVAVPWFLRGAGCRPAMPSGAPVCWPDLVHAEEIATLQRLSKRQRHFQKKRPTHIKWNTYFDMKRVKLKHNQILQLWPFTSYKYV